MIMFEKGRVVISRAGRDRDYLLVIMQADEKSVFVCDGKERPIDRPKKKNIRHIEPTEYVIDISQITTNRAIRKELRRISDEINCNV